MKLTPTIKGQITKLVNKITVDNSWSRRFATYHVFKTKFNMPHEQAKHAAKKYLATAS